MVNVPLYLQYAEVAQETDAYVNANRQVFNGGTSVNRYVRLLYLVRRAVQWKYDQNPNDASLEATANYMYALSGGRNVTPITPATTFIIIIQPQSLTVDTGDNASFLVAVAGGTQPYSYVWRFNGTPIGGETNPTLDLTNVDSGDAGAYSCVITDANGLVLTSVNAILTVNAAAITGSYYYGSTDYFSALSGGTDNITYQGTFSIIHNANISVPFPLAAGNNKFLVIRVPVGESLKSNWFNTAFNYGTIQPPDGIFRAPLQPAGLPLYTYYLTELEVSNDFNSPLILS